MKYCREQCGINNTTNPRKTLISLSKSNNELRIHILEGELFCRHVELAIRELAGSISEKIHHKKENSTNLRKSNDLQNMLLLRKCSTQP